MALRGAPRAVSAVVLAAVLAVGWALAATRAGAVVSSAKHYFAADGSAADFYSQSDTASWTGSAQYGHGHTTATGDKAFLVGDAHYLTLPDAAAGNFGTADFTVRLWVRMTPKGNSSQEIFSKRSQCNSGSFIDLREIGTTGLRFELQDASNFGFGVTNPTDVADGSWHKVTVLRQGKTLDLAVDGKLATATSGALIDLDSPAPMMFDNGPCIGVDGTLASNALLDDISFGSGDTVVGGPAPPNRPATPKSSHTPAPGHSTPPGTAPSHRPLPSKSVQPGHHHRHTTRRHHRARHHHRRTHHRHRSHPRPHRSSSHGAPVPVGSPRPPGSGGRPRTELSRSAPAATFNASVPRPGDAFTSARIVGQDALLGVLLLGLLALPITVINRTAIVHAEELGSLAGGLRRRIGLDTLDSWSEQVPTGARLGVAAIVAGVLYGFVEPTVGLNLSSIALFAGLALGLGALLTARVITQIVVLRRSFDITALLRFFPGFALIAAGCVTFSRLIGLQPGLLLGSLVGLVSTRRLREYEEGRAVAVSFAVVASLAVGAFYLRAIVVSGSSNSDGFWRSLLGVALTTVVVAGVEVLVFEGLPLSFFEGEVIFRWSRTLWAVLTTFGAFCFVHLIVHPVATESEYARHVAYLCYLLAVYLAVAFAFWGWFRYRPARFRPRIAAGAEIDLVGGTEPDVM